MDSSSRLSRSYKAVIFASVCLVLISSAPSRLTAHLWRFHCTTFRAACHCFIFNHVQNFILHGLRFGVTEMDFHLVGSRPDPPVHNGGIFALFLNCADNFLPFLRLGRNSALIDFVPTDLLPPLRYPSHFQPPFSINCA